MLQLEVTGITAGGFGAARAGKRRYLVWGGLPGDVVSAQVVRRERGRTQARVAAVLSSKIQRVAPQCRHFAVCGGCLWQDLRYEDQLVLKRRLVAQAFREAGMGSLEVAEVIGCEDVFPCRNKMEFSFGQHASGALMLGLFADARKPSARGVALSESRGGMLPVFDVETCWLQAQDLNQIVDVSRRVLDGCRLRAYNPEARSGVLRSLTVREGTRTGEVLVSLAVGSAKHLPAGPFVEAVTAASARVKGVALSVSRKRSRHAVPKSQEALFGETRITERVLGLEIEVSPTSFLQVNTPQAERLYALALSYAGLTGRERVLDLYCGTGTLSLLLAQRSAGVTGVESLEEAVADARRNALRNGVANCRFACGDVLETAPGLLADGERVDVVTVNPPRAGLHPGVIRAICRHGPPRVVYISCNPQTLARDLGVFQKAGYCAEIVQPVDLFPHTPHCEAVVNLSRGGSASRK